MEWAVLEGPKTGPNFKGQEHNVLNGVSLGNPDKTWLIFGTHDIFFDFENITWADPKLSQVTILRNYHSRSWILSKDGHLTELLKHFEMTWGAETQFALNLQ